MIAPLLVACLTDTIRVCLSQLREQGVEDEEANVSAQRATMKKRQQKTKKPRESKLSRSVLASQGRKDDEETPSRRAVPRNRNSRSVMHNDDSDEGRNAPADTDNQSVASSRPRRTQKTVVASTDIFSDNSSSAEESEEEDGDAAPAASRKRNRIVEDSSGSEQSE